MHPMNSLDPSGARRGSAHPLLLAVIAAVALLAGCGGAGGAATTPASTAGGGEGQMTQLTLTQADSGKTVDLKVGDTCVVSLSENPTTGYRWGVDQIDAQILTIEKDEYKQAPGAGVGGGGTRVLTIEAVGRGTSPLRLKLWREWEGDASIRERFDLTVRVT